MLHLQTTTQRVKKSCARNVHAFDFRRRLLRKIVVKYDTLDNGSFYEILSKVLTLYSTVFITNCRFITPPIITQQ